MKYYMIMLDKLVGEAVISTIKSGLEVRYDLNYGNDDHLQLAVL